MLETTVPIKILKLSNIGLVLYLDGETAWELLVLLVMGSKTDSANWQMDNFRLPLVVW